MPYCKNNPKRSYKGTEPSPKGLGYCASGEKIGSKKKGRDGNMWIVKKISSGSKRWYKHNSENKLDCSKFARYEKREKGSFGTTIKYVEGLRGKRGYIYKLIDFNQFEKEETKVPDGYKLVKLRKDYTKNYKCDNSRKLLSKNNDQYKKIRIATKGFKKYFTHDNGGRPFLVYVNKNKKEVQIYKQLEKDYYIPWSDWEDNDNKNAWMYIQLVAKYKSSEIFIGKSPLNKMTEFSGGHGERFDGNSILLKIGKDRYVHIGSHIYEFSTPNDKIVKYYSPVGNNDVPYPFAYGEKNVYFMLDEKYVSYDKASFLANKKETDAYTYYYGHSGDVKVEKYAKKMKSVKIIQKRLWE